MWRGFFQHFSECGRRGAFFYLAFVVVCPVLSLISLLLDLISPSVLAIVLAALFCVVLGIGCSLNRPPRLGRLPPLMPLDLRLARNKLLKLRLRK